MAVGRGAIDLVAGRAGSGSRGDARNDPVAIGAVVFAVRHQDGDLLRIGRSIVCRAVDCGWPEIAEARREHVPAPGDADMAAGRARGRHSVDCGLERRAIVGQRNDRIGRRAGIAGRRIVAAERRRTRRRIRIGVSARAFADAGRDLVDPHAAAGVREPEILAALRRAPGLAAGSVGVVIWTDGARGARRRVGVENKAVCGDAADAPCGVGRVVDRLGGVRRPDRVDAETGDAGHHYPVAVRKAVVDRAEDKVAGRGEAFLDRAAR